MKKMFCILLAGAVGVSLFAGCASQQPEQEPVAVVTEEPTPTATSTPTPTPTPAATPTATPTPSPTPTEVPLEGVNPFTGLPMDTELLTKRPYAFMVNNISSSMPQVGTSKSDMIMELMDEGGITRMMVFFQDPSEVEAIGSIRSARVYNVETALGYDALLAHCGNSDEADWLIHVTFQMEDLDQIDGSYGEDVFYRDPDRVASLGSVHSLMARGAGIVAAAEARGYRLDHEEGYDLSQGLQFSDNAADQCTEEANHINIVYNGGKNTEFIYDPATAQYTMFQHGQEFLDNNVEKVPFSNVIMIYANTYLQEDGQHLSIDLTEGTGLFFTGGRVVPINWYKSNCWDTFHYTLQDGTPLSLSRGRTFVAVNQSGSYQGSCDYSV